MQIRQIHLLARDVAAQKRFYRDRLGLTLSAQDDRGFTVETGASRIVFRGGETALEPFYHFAFNIPQNQMGAARDWLDARVQRLVADGKDEWFFADWNAHAVYFFDPDGNDVEWIARHNLPNTSDAPFSPNALLGVSEIGLAVPDVPAALAQLEERLGIRLWRGDGQSFAAVGDEEGLFIVVPEGRLWLGTQIPATLVPTTVVVAGARDDEFTLDGTPHRVVVVAGGGS